MHTAHMLTCTHMCAHTLHTQAYVHTEHTCTAAPLHTHLHTPAHPTYAHAFVSTRAHMPSQVHWLEGSSPNIQVHPGPHVAPSSLCKSGGLRAFALLGWGPRLQLPTPHTLTTVGLSGLVEHPETLLRRKWSNSRGPHTPRGRKGPRQPQSAVRVARVVRGPVLFRPEGPSCWPQENSSVQGSPAGPAVLVRPEAGADQAIHAPGPLVNRRELTACHT